MAETEITGNKDCEKNFIKILNHQNGDTVKYPLVLLEGFVSERDWQKVGETTAVGQSAISFKTVNEEDKPEPKDHILVESDQICSSWPVIDGGFKVLAMLSPGENILKFKYFRGSCLAHELDYKLWYQKLQVKRFVRVVYIKCEDSDGSFDAPAGIDNSIDMAVKKLKLNVQLLQTFTAENMNKQGLGHTTFRVEQEEDGSPKVYIFTSSLKTSEALSMTGGELYDKFSTELSRSNLNDPLCKWWVFMSCTHYDPPLDDDEFKESNITEYVKAHTALGGGQLALFGTGCLHTWASEISEVVHCFTDTRLIDKRKLFDDSCGRGSYWANYATTLGASMHELGHCFDLAHTPGGIMGRGFDDMNCVFTLWRTPPPPRQTDEVAGRLSKGNIEERTDPHATSMENVENISPTSSLLVSSTPCVSRNSSNVQGGHMNAAISKPGDWLHGATWYRASAIVLRYHKWFMEGDVAEDEQCLPMVHWRSDMCGPVGNFGGSYQRNQVPFSDEKWLNSENATIAGFIVHADNYVNRIQTVGIVHKTNSDHASESKQVMSEARGGNAVSEPQSFFFADPDEYLTRVEVRAGAWIDAIRFHSNKRSSEWMGGSGGDLYCLAPPPGKRIMGLFGTAGHYVGSIGLQLSRDEGDEDEVEASSMAIRSPNGLRLIEFRNKQHDQVCKHWEFLDKSPPTSYMIPRTELTENDCGGMMIVDNKGIILRVGTLYDYSNVL